jgi:C4-dicarboxylate transporter DctM subunit
MSAPTQSREKPPVVVLVLLALIVAFPFLGKGGVLTAAILTAVLFGVPLFVLLGIVTMLCFFLWAGYGELDEFMVLVERIRSLADNPALLAIPLFMASGAVMSRGEISKRLIDFAQALVGFLPGGLAISAVVACMLFASISGSSPATVVAIGGMMGPAMIAQGYRKEFAHGLVTSAGSLGILIPPSIPMIVYPIVNQSSAIEVESLFMAGVGPGIVMGGVLMGYSVYRGIVGKSQRTPFSWKRLGIAARDGFWSLMFPVLILGGIHLGLFNAVEAAGISVVYAVAIELYVHRALKPRELTGVLQETGVLLGSFLVIMVSALAFNEFLEGQGIPAAAVDWLKSFDLSRTQFLLIVNVLLLAVGMFMDILSAMLVFVPLLAPMALSFGIDPIHFGIIFIVNLEIGYLTPPVGLNLFVASTLFKEPLGNIMKSIVPFVASMAVALAAVTAFPQLSVGLSNWLLDKEPVAPIDAPQNLDTEGPAQAEEQRQEQKPGIMTMEEMMRAAEDNDDGDADVVPTPKPQPKGPQRVMTMEEMMREAEREKAE